MNGIVGFDELKQHIGGRSSAELAARLTAAGIRYHRGINGKPWTTIEAINESLGLKPKKDKTNTTIVVK